MGKVVEDPAAVVPIMPLLQPLVSGAVAKISDPEARSVAERALATLEKAAAGADMTKVEPEQALSIMKDALSDADGAAEVGMAHVASCAAMACNMMRFDTEDWK